MLGEGALSVARAGSCPARATAYGGGAMVCMIASTERSSFAGTLTQVADELARWVRHAATDGLNISPCQPPRTAAASSIRSTYSLPSVAAR